MNDNVQSLKASVILMELRQSLGNVREDIQKFFSSTEGKGDKIKKVYHAIHEGSQSYKRIPVRDVNFAIHTYIDDYYDGLKKFISEIISIQDSDSLKEKEADISNNIETAKSKDSAFIKSLFDDLRNPINGDETLSNAMKSLESLVDFLDRLDSIDRDIEGFIIGIKTNDTEKFVIDGMSLYSASVNMFVNETVKCIKDIFEDIQRAVFNDQRQSSVVESTGFKLFD